MGATTPAVGDGGPLFRLATAGHDGRANEISRLPTGNQTLSDEPFAPPAPGLGNYSSLTSGSEMTRT